MIHIPDLSNYLLTHDMVPIEPLIVKIQAELDIVRDDSTQPDIPTDKILYKPYHYNTNQRQ